MSAQAKQPKPARRSFARAVFEEALWLELEGTVRTFFRANYLRLLRDPCRLGLPLLSVASSSRRYTASNKLELGAKWLHLHCVTALRRRQGGRMRREAFRLTWLLGLRQSSEASLRASPAPLPALTTRPRSLDSRCQLCTKTVQFSARLNPIDS
jgi:hypothetical protein